MLTACLEDISESDPSRYVRANTVVVVGVYAVVAEQLCHNIPLEAPYRLPIIRNCVRCCKSGPDPTRGPTIPEAIGSGQTRTCM